MAEEAARTRAPDLVGGYWLNSEPLTLATEAPGLALYAYTFVSCVAA